MGYRFVETKKDIQKQMAYAVYKTLADMFEKSECENKILEQNLKIHYTEFTQKKQSDVHKRIIRQLKRSLGTDVDELKELRAEMRITRYEALIIIEAYTGIENIVVGIARNGEYRVKIIR